ncbi:MAG: hypothetical protein HOD90_11555 [Nitrospina sp.]|nr:hypothetical protein [Nitrospina sp.]MBT5258658.1 hypothetical protein [Nitrospina sp.]
MATLKGILFSKYVDKGLNSLLEELQKKYGEKKGRRFNYNNITYEVSRSSLVDENIQFEISSKIPQDELKDRKDMKGYFTAIKKLATKFNKKPIAVEMENIIIDTKKNTEKKRDYVKLLYSYPLDELYSENEILKKTKGMKHQAQGEILSSEASGALTQQGNLALQLVKESIQSLARQNIEALLDANNKIKA